MKVLQPLQTIFDQLIRLMPRTLVRPLVDKFPNKRKTILHQRLRGRSTRCHVGFLILAWGLEYRLAVDRGGVGHVPDRLLPHVCECVLRGYGSGEKGEVLVQEGMFLLESYCRKQVSIWFKRRRWFEKSGTWGVRKSKGERGGGRESRGTRAGGKEEGKGEEAEGCEERRRRRARKGAKRPRAKGKTRKENPAHHP